MNQEELIDSLWIEFADGSDGFQGTMSYEAFVAAMDKYTTTLRAQDAQPQHTQN